MCNCGKTESTEETLRRVALSMAVDHVYKGMPTHEVVAAAADFYNFLNGQLVTSNIDKLSAIADILADD